VRTNNTQTTWSFSVVLGQLAHSINKPSQLLLAQYLSFTLGFLICTSSHGLPTYFEFQHSSPATLSSTQAQTNNTMELHVRACLFIPKCDTPNHSDQFPEE